MTDEQQTGPSANPLVEVRIRNVKRLPALTIRPQGSVVVLAGDNGAGKTSASEAIWATLGGASTHDPQMIREGAREGGVVLTFQSGLRVTRTWKKERGTALEIEMPGGDRLNKPQAWLDQNTCRLGLDLSKILDARGADLASTLIGLAGGKEWLDEHAAAMLEVYEERTAVNRMGKRKAAVVADADVSAFCDLPAEPVDEDEIARRIEVAHQRNLAKQQAHAVADAASNAIEDAQRRCVDAVALIEEREVELKAAETALRAAMDDLEVRNLEVDRRRESATKAKEHAAEAPDPEPMDALQAEAKEANAINVRVLQRDAHAASLREVDGLRHESHTLTNKLDDLSRARIDYLRKLPMPIDGLTVTEAGPQWNGLPFEQASASERIRVAASIAMAHKPEIRILRVEDGPLLDEASMAALGDVVAANGYLALVERITDSGEGRQVVHLVDGEEATE